ncbi:MAG TPA: TraR/DksA C4-type zinc finger protein [Candidatus Pacearchaeota archaeon]|jgi:RNA polymerase-binding transcription factor DksA|nr:TraR/DksA C4-type zinc finger protein [Candidatus Pacearchaeota archaeon]HRU20581.1 TraR/DksA C4-type zinc finger protein [Candidatus Paceibacterota bacterium]HPC30690.1 TraR/DksA C4-type zinc finger protein [Candidatus Pacearchaeota archaeon]HQG09051.1 TraR/DksA C4-type zinc finger protein [Candidatus Pacearchaeota archaeon]HQH20052.1 TraR/DksA C4-type zinc finger protein [Candidatus Pacearchaeota archaeon]
MDHQTIEELKKQLEIKKLEIEKELDTLSEREKNEKVHDFKFPNDETNTDIEDETFEVEEFENLLPVGYVLEETLKNINLALQKIQNNLYGKCEKCHKDIPLERLRALPEARYCNECNLNK